VADRLPARGGPLLVGLLGRERSLGPVRLRELHGIYGSVGGPLCADLGRAARGASLEALLRAFGPWDLLRVQRLRRCSPWLTLQAELAYVAPEPDGGAGVIDVSGDRERLWRSLRPKLRSNLRRMARRIEQRGGAQVVEHEGASLEAAFDRHVELEAAGWKGRRGTALNQDEPLAGAVRSFFATTPGCVVRQLLVGGVLAASQLCVRWEDRIYVFKQTYNESLSELSPSKILLIDLLERACEDPTVRAIDGFVWEPWNSEWPVAREPTVSLVAFNPASARGRLAHALWRARRAVRRGAADPAFLPAAAYRDSSSRR